MKKLLCLLLIVCFFTACGAPAASVSEALPEYTEEELFLQDAYWYLQSDEKQILNWENGTVEDFYTETDLYAMGPQGEVNIRDQQLQRVYYKIWDMGDDLYETVDLYFEPDGTFVGMGRQLYINETVSPRDADAYWEGDISFWVFLDRPTGSEAEELTVTCILKDGEGTGMTFSAAAPYFAEIEIYKDGVQLMSGLDAAGQSINFSLEPIVQEEHIVKLSNVAELARKRDVEPTGEYTMRVTAYLTEEYNDQLHTEISLSRYLTFTIE